MFLWLATGALLSVSVVHACSWTYTIWSIRSKPADPLFRFEQNGKAGYIDATGKIVVRPTYPGGSNFLGEFHEGLLAVRDERGARYVDRSGKVVFRTDSRFSSDFFEGLAAASSESSRWGFIDRTGRFTVPPQYYEVEAFSEGIARISVTGEVGSTGYIDKTGQFVIPPSLTYGSSFHEDRAAVIISGPCRITNGRVLRNDPNSSQPETMPATIAAMPSWTRAASPFQTSALTTPWISPKGWRPSEWVNIGAT